MSSVCITRSISLESQDDTGGFYSPTADLGRDFEYLVRKCIAEKMAKQTKVATSEIFGDDQSEGTSTPEEASLDMPNESDIESGTSTDDRTNASTLLQEHCMKCITQHDSCLCNTNGTRAVENAQEKLFKAQEISDEQSIETEEKYTETQVESKKVSFSTSDQPEENVNELMNNQEEAIFAPLEFPPLLKEKLKPKKHHLKSAKRKPKKPGMKNCKWKIMTNDSISFNLSLLPRRANTMPLTDCDLIYDIQEELTKFEEITQQESAVDVPNFEQEILSDRVFFSHLLEAESELDTNSDIEPQEYLAEKLSLKELNRITEITDNRTYKCLRRKHKFKYQKAHKAIKTKNFSVKNIINRPHGRKLYVNHRLKDFTTLCSSYVHFLPTPHNKKRKVIDGKGFVYSFDKRGHKTREYKKVQNRNNVPQRNYPVAQPIPHYALRNNNADAALDNELVNILLNLQNRDLTPEDYELLLRLDERVAPKTVDLEVLNSFHTDKAVEVGGECAVCMETFQIGDIRKHLPCGHIFHKNCIENWLTNSSLNCPLDGLPVNSS